MAPDKDSLTRELISYFSHLDEEVLKACLAICLDFNIPADRLYFKWEAKTFNAGSANPKAALATARPPFDLSAARELRSIIQRENEQIALDRKAKNDVAAKANINRIGMRGRFARGGAVRPSVGVGTGAKQEDVGAIGFGIHPLPGVSRSFSSGISTTVSLDCVSTDSKDRQYRYMYEKIFERSTALDAQISKFEDLVIRHYDIQLSNPADFTDDEIHTVGRITFDSESASSPAPRLNEATLTLEVSREIGSGERIPLRFVPNPKIRVDEHGARGANGFGGLGLFPGAIVALKGRNGGGGSFMVSEILTLPLLPRRPGRAPGAAFSMAIACGPYTSDGDLKYGPLRALLSSLATRKPDVLLFLGPFIDASHGAIRAGDTDHTPSELFSVHFANPIRDLLTSNPGTLVLIMPSVRDLLGKHAVYPQAELDNTLLIDSRVTFLPNPCRFSLNGVTFAATSVDTLFHLRKEEILVRGEEVSQTGDSLMKTENTSGGGHGGDVMANTCRHLLQQRSFYPLFPAPFDLARDVNLDVTHSELLAMDYGTGLEGNNGDAATTPEVLILPSRLKHFGKTIDETTTAVNPSFVSKGAYAHLNIKGSSVHTDIVRLDDEARP